MAGRAHGKSFRHGPSLLTGMALAPYPTRALDLPPQSTARSCPRSAPPLAAISLSPRPCHPPLEEGRKEKRPANMIRVLTTTPRARARAHRPLRAQPSSSLLALTGLALVRPRRSKALATERDRPGDRPAGPPSRTPHLQRPQMGAKIIVLARLGAQGGTWAIDSSTIPDLGEKQNKGPSRTPAHLSGRP